MDEPELKHKVQNRLLMVAMALAFLHYADAKISGMSFVGANVQFRNDNAVLEFLWVIWFYYYLRCYQYFKATGAKEFASTLNVIYMQELGHRILHLDRKEFELLDTDDAVKSSILRMRPVLISRHMVHQQTHALQPRQKALGRIGTWWADRMAMRAWRRGEKLWRRRAHINFLRDLAPWWQRPAPLSWLWRRPGLRVTVYPPSNHEELQGQHKYHVYLGASAIHSIATVYLKAVFFRPAFTESYGALILGLIPVWQLIYTHRAAMFRS